MKHVLICFCLLFVGLLPVSSFADDTSDQIAKVEKKISKKLNSYYVTKGAVGIPSSAEPQSVDIDIDSTKPVEGWTRRYFTVGTATIMTSASAYAPNSPNTSAPTYTRNYACHFEVTTEIDDDGVVQIVGIKSERVNH
jgi:hypothetical protein